MVKSFTIIKKYQYQSTLIISLKTEPDTDIRILNYSLYVESNKRNLNSEALYIKYLLTLCFIDI